MMYSRCPAIRAPDSTPISGRVQATDGRGGEIGYPRMKKTGKRSTPPHMESREILAANLRARMDERFANAADRVEALHKRSGVARSTIQRILKSEVGATLDTIAHAAMALGCEPYELLLPPQRAVERVA